MRHLAPTLVIAAYLQVQLAPLAVRSAAATQCLSGGLPPAPEGL